jgi:hydrogenase expression/formation protein HypE
LSIEGKRLPQTPPPPGRATLALVGETPLPTGKLPAALLRELLAAGPPLPAEVRLGPGVGEDACAIDLPAGTLIAATDPITLTGTGVGGHSVWVNANDVAVMGARPRWFLAAALFPPGTHEREVRAMFEGTRAALARIGAALVGGHCEVTGAVTQPVVVGQMLGLIEEGGFVRTGGARPGDAIVQVGPVPVEGAAVLAGGAPERLADVPRAAVALATRALEEPGVSIVEPALLAARLGASSLHDPTEGGLATGLHEVAEASGVALEIDAERVLWFEPGLTVCRAFGADPWGTLASGALLAAFPGERVQAALDALASAGFDARVIGRAAPGSGARLAGGEPLPRFDRDELVRVLA